MPAALFKSTLTFCPLSLSHRVVLTVFIKYSCQNHKLSAKTFDCYSLRSLGYAKFQIIYLVENRRIQLFILFITESV